MNQISKSWFHVKSQWQKNPEISTLCTGSGFQFLEEDEVKDKRVWKSDNSSTKWTYFSLGAIWAHQHSRLFWRLCSIEIPIVFLGGRGGHCIPRMRSSRGCQCFVNEDVRTFHVIRILGTANGGAIHRWRRWSLLIWPLKGHTPAPENM